MSTGRLASVGRGRGSLASARTRPSAASPRRSGPDRSPPVARRARASTPSVATLTSKPARSRMLRCSSRTVNASSTTRMCRGRRRSARHSLGRRPTLAADVPGPLDEAGRIEDDEHRAVGLDAGAGDDVDPRQHRAETLDDDVALADERVDLERVAVQRAAADDDDRAGRAAAARRDGRAPRRAGDRHASPSTHRTTPSLAVGCRDVGGRARRRRGAAAARSVGRRPRPAGTAAPPA